MEDVISEPERYRKNTMTKNKIALAALSGGLIGCYGKPLQHTILAVIGKSPQHAKSCSLATVSEVLSHYLQ